jgi:acetylornithine/succinyldiaminopimelate/putrescine aminotransferase/predicted amino acid dehydrogenase
MLNPPLSRLRRAAGLDRRFVRGEGVWLFDGEGLRFLDGWSQYGAVALGHNHPRVVAAARAALDEAAPSMVQPWPAPHAEELAERLCRLSGLDACLFTTSGAEAVEAALKLVRAATGRSVVLAAEGSFHGKTLGALSLTGQARHRDGMGPLLPDVVHVPWGDAQALTKAFADGPIAALFLEPIQGERGVHLPPPGWLELARNLCTIHGAALVVDEIQTGLGRTGSMFASGVKPDVLLLAKALGGGLFPLGSVLCKEELFCDQFALSHSSTFANNDAACRVALSVLDVLEGGLVEEAAQRGLHLQERLARLPLKFPRTVRSVRGRGMLGAVELAPREDGLFASYLWHQGLWPYAVAATLAEQASLLVLPTLGEAAVLRVAPPLVISDEEIDLLGDALESVLAPLERGASELVARCTGALSGRIEPVSLPLPRPLAPSPSRWAFLIHYTQPDDVLITDPALARLSEEERAAFAGFAASMPPGVVVRAHDGLVIALPLLPSEMARRGRREMEAEIVRAVDLAARLGAGVVGLGGYTAPYSRRGLAVIGRGPTITTGNTLTAAMAVAASLRAVGDRGVADLTVAVVGARGSVGALCARLLARELPRRLILIGNPRSSSAQLEKFAGEIGAEPGDLSSLAEADLIVSAAAAGRPILGEAPIAGGTIICDVARPPDAPPSLRARRDVTVIDGGLVALPDSTMRFGAGNLQGLPDGIQLACLAETMLLARAGERRDRGVGDTIWLDEADELMALATQHGFGLPALSIDQRREVNK